MPAAQALLCMGMIENIARDWPMLSLTAVTITTGQNSAYNANLTGTTRS